MIHPAIVDTNVLVSGLITSVPDAAPRRIAFGMVGGRFPFVLSLALLDEYRKVLGRERIRARHGLDDDELDRILVEITANAIVFEKPPSARSLIAPDVTDQHLFDLLEVLPEAILVTGDRRLLDIEDLGREVIMPVAFAAALP